MQFTLQPIGLYSNWGIHLSRGSSSEYMVVEGRDVFAVTSNRARYEFVLRLLAVSIRPVVQVSDTQDGTSGKRCSQIVHDSLYVVWA